MDIKQFIKEVGLEDKLPFVINFKMKPSDWQGEYQTVAGLSLPKMNCLTTREAYILDAIDDKAGKNNRDARLQTIVVQLAQELSLAISEPDLKLCLKYVMDTPENIQQHENFPKYLEMSQPLRTEFLEIAKEISNPMVVWCKVTAFLMFRNCETWTFERVIDLPETTIAEIYQYMEQERNPVSEELSEFEEPESPEEVNVSEGK